MLAAFAGEALLPDVFRVQVALERLRGGQPLEDVPLLLGGVRRPRADRLQPLLDEALGRRVRDVHVLGAERAAVRVLERRDEVAQPHPLGPGLERADVELGVEVGLREAVRREIEIGGCSGFSWRFSGSRSAWNMPSVRNLLISRSTSTCLCIVAASTIAPATLRLLARGG